MILTPLTFLSCQKTESQALLKVKKVDLSTIDPALFSEEEWFVPYYLNHFAAVANSVVDAGDNRGYFNLSVWRGSQNHHTYNARIMEGILSLVWFYCTDRPWNPYYNDPALKKRIEASLEFWCKIQNKDGEFSEYRVAQWSLAPTAFASKFIGKALWLLNKGPQIDAVIFEKSKEALRKAIYIGFTSDKFWQHGVNYTNQFANLWGGALLYLDVWPDEEIEELLKQRMQQSMTEFQSPAGFFYEKGGPDWGYNLSTHHSDLQVAWEYANEELRNLIIRKTEDWYNWFSYNAVKEPDSRYYYLNRAIETRQQKGFFENEEQEDPAYQRWTPQSEFIPVARAFEMSDKEYEVSNKRLYQKMLDEYPKVADLEVGEFNAFTPYAFLHHNMKLWHPKEEQKVEAINNLPYLKNSNFIHVRTDDRSSTSYIFVRKPTYYATFNCGKVITSQQRFGLGLLWNPEFGTVFQSQSKTDVAAYGTKPENAEQVYEAGGINARFLLEGKTLDFTPGKTDVEPGELDIQYKLGDEGHKSISFKNNKIVVSIEYSGEFTEILPLLISSKDVLIIDKNRIQLKCEKGNMIIQLSDNIAIQPKNFESDLTKKECKVIEVKASRKLNYEILFE